MRRLKMFDLSLAELLSGDRQLTIPHYQRDYTWERAHVRQLLDDVLSASMEARTATDPLPYFLGSMLICEQKEAGAIRYDVVDGQQRLITLTIAFACLRDLMKDRSAELQTLIQNGADMRLRLRQTDRDFFSGAVQANGATRQRFSSDDQLSTTHSNVLEARAELLRRLRALPVAERPALLRFLLEQCRVVLIQADDFDYAYQIFLSINERGKELTVEDVFQAELLGPLTDDEQIRYAPIIGQIGKYRRENNQNVSRAKTFFSHIAAANGWRGGPIVASIREAIKASGGSRAFSTGTFIPMAEAYLALIGQLPLPPGLAPSATTAIEHLRMLEEHGDDDWLASALLVLVRSTTGSDDQARVLCALDRYAHILMAIGYGGTARKALYAPINRAIIAGETWDKIVRRLTPGAAVQQRALRNIAQRLHDSDKATCRLFLLRIDSHLSKRPLAHYRAMPSYPLRKEGSLTVEHLLPKGSLLREGAGWRALYPDERHRQVCAQYLGNLTPVTEEENRELGQHPMATKAAVLGRRGRHPIAITDELCRLSDWSYEALMARHKRLMDAVTQIWLLEGDYPMPPKPPASRKKAAG